MVTPGFMVRTPGLQTTLQDWPGRVGHWRVGIPPSGPMDSVSFRLANLLVGNDPGETAMEIQFLGPELESRADVAVAIVGADCMPSLDGEPMPTGEVVRLARGQILSFGPIMRGARAYLAVAGGFAKELVLGSTATFPRGGIGGRGLEQGQVLELKAHGVRHVGRRLRSGLDLVTREMPVRIAVTAGAHFDWLSPSGRDTLLEEEWTVSAKSDRTGIRLIGPALAFSERAVVKSPDNGTDPSNVINTGYPIGGVNICGNTPIILPVDGPSQGGFITPIVVASACMSQIGQLAPNRKIRFLRVSLDEAIALRRSQDEQVNAGAIEEAA